MIRGKSSGSSANHEMLSVRGLRLFVKAIRLGRGQSTSASVASIGLFSVLLDGVLMDSHDFGIVTANSSGWKLLSTLDFTTTRSAGEHTLSLEVTRLFAPAINVDSEYFDNVSLNVTSAVPEPTTWAMMILRFAGIGFMAYRRKSAVLAV
jgi:hypothetical protein